MKHIRFSFSVNCLTVILLFCTILLSCNQPVKELKVITVSGCTFIDNVTWHNAEFGSLADSGETTALVVSDGDLLYTFGGDNGFIAYIRYSEEYGQHLAITMDSTYPGFVRINGEIHSLYLDNSSECTEWVKSLDREDLASLRFLHLSVDSDSFDLSALELIATAKPDIGLSVENFEERELTEIISMFYPTSLILMDIDSYSQMDPLVPNLDNLQLIYLEGGSMESGNFLYQLPALKSLIISDWDPASQNPAPFEKLSNLESLTLVKSKIKYLATIGQPEKLTSLYLIGCEWLTDISHLMDLKRIQCLGLMECDTLTDLSVLKEIPSLQWLSFPPDISQADFSDILQHHMLLQGVELLGCENITDISSLVQLRALKSLAIGGMEIDYKTLQQLESAELIVIEEDSFSEDEEEVAALKEALPGAHIVPGGGFCMGSGWILLLLPVLLIALGYRRFLRK
jgi:hypothetical protein